MSILEELYYGNICPNEKVFDGKSEYAKFIGIIADNEKTLSDYFKAQPETQDKQHLFSQLMNAQEEISSFNECNRFLEGFRLGAGIMIETFVVPQQSVLRDIN